MMKDVILCVAILLASGECLPQASEAVESAPEPSSTDIKVDEAVDQVFQNAKSVISQLESAGLPEISTSNDMNHMNEVSKKYAQQTVDAFSDLMTNINTDEQMETLKMVGRFSKDLFLKSFDFVEQLSSPAKNLMKDVSQIEVN